MRIARIVLGVSVAIAGCSGSATRDAGDDTDFVPHGPDVGPPPPHDAAIGDLGGDHWEGEVDGLALPSGSSHVRIWLDHASGDGPRTGLVTFGEGPAFPLPTRGDIGYPPGFGFDSIGTMDNDLTEGFGYPFEAGSSAIGAHVTVRINGSGLWEPWCELQTPVPLGDGSGDWGCLPEGGGQGNATECIYEPVNGPAYPIDCGRMLLCQPPGICDCTATGCVARERVTRTFDFDVSGASAEGTLDGLPLHLTR